MNHLGLLQGSHIVYWAKEQTQCDHRQVIEVKVSHMIDMKTSIRRLMSNELRI